MLNIQVFVCNPLRENTYVVSDESKECVIIDCGALYDVEKEAIRKYIEDNNLKPTRLIATHGHVDHHFGDRFVYDTWGLKPELHGSDEEGFGSLPLQASTVCGIDGLSDDDFVPAGQYLSGADNIVFGSHRLDIVETPGHSPGSVTYLCEDEKVAFTGDTLFRGSIGRTDFKGGSMFLIILSLRKLCQLADDITVYPGHGPTTTIGQELSSNPYLDR